MKFFLPFKVIDSERLGRDDCQPTQGGVGVEAEPAAQGGLQGELLLGDHRRVGVDPQPAHAQLVVAGRAAHDPPLGAVDGPAGHPRGVGSDVCRACGDP